MKKIIQWIKNIFRQTCPDCGGKMDNIMLDPQFDRLVYECAQCNKEFI